MQLLKISWDGVTTVLAHPEVVGPLCLCSVVVGAVGKHYIGPWISELFSDPDPAAVVEKLMKFTLKIKDMLFDAIRELHAKAKSSKGEPFSISAFVAKVPGAAQPSKMESRYRLCV